MVQQGSPCCGSLKWLSGRYNTKGNLIGPLDVEKLAKASFLYVFNRGFPASPLQNRRVKRPLWHLGKEYVRVNLICWYFVQNIAESFQIVAACLAQMGQYPIRCKGCVFQTQYMVEIEIQHKCLQCVSQQGFKTPFAVICHHIKNLVLLKSFFQLSICWLGGISIKVALEKFIDKT